MARLPNRGYILLEASGEVPKSNIRRKGVMAQIKWLSDFEGAVSAAKAEKKPVLLDFFNPG